MPYGLTILKYANILYVYAESARRRQALKWLKTWRKHEVGIIIAGIKEVPLFIKTHVIRDRILNFLYPSHISYKYYWYS